MSQHELQLMELKSLESKSLSAETSLKLIRADKARADKMLKEILSLISSPPMISTPVKRIY